MAKGRVQDCSGTVMQQILADGKNAIPILISQLTETARTKKQIEDYGAILAPATSHSSFSMICLPIPTCAPSECPAYRIGLLSKKDATARPKPAGTTFFENKAGGR